MTGSIGWMRFWVLQSLFWSSGIVFAHSMKKRNRFALRAGCFFAIILAYSLLFRFVFWDGSRLTEIVARVFSICLMCVFLYLGYEISFHTAIYNCIWAVMTSLLLEETWSVFEFQGREYFSAHPWMIVVFMVCLYGIVYTVMLKTIGKWLTIDQRDSVGPRQAISASLIFAIIVVLANSNDLRHISEDSSEWRFFFISQILCAVILYLQNEMFKKSAMRNELEIINMLWKSKQEQYELSRENIDLINQKSHDLKHQLRALRKLNKEEFDRYLDDIEDTVQIYESIVKTGNDVFDTILTEKSLYCRKHEIKINCIADGSQMEFINAVDLYAILGNALDNAIEAVQKFKDPGKRQIDVVICRQQNFLVMNFMNPVRETPVFEDDFPVTTKGDRRYHGFGLRSIRHFVRKYDGYLNISVEDGCFSLKIMMPIP